jgi:ATP-binding cassette subfamily B protein
VSKQRYSAPYLYRRVLEQVRPYWPHLGLTAFLGLLATPIALILPLPLKIVVDSVIDSHPAPGFLSEALPLSEAPDKGIVLVLAVGMLLVITIINYGQRLAAWLLNEYVSEKTTLYFRGQLFEQAQRLSLTYHDEEGVADAAYRVQHDAPAVSKLTTWGLLPVVSALFTLAGMIYVTARISLPLAGIALLVAPALVILAWLYSGRLWTRWSRVKELEASAFGVVQEVLGAIRVVLAFGRETHELDRFERKATTGLVERMKVALTQSSFNLFLGLTIGIGTAAVLFVGAKQVQAGTITVGALLLVMAYIAQLYEPMQQIGEKIASQQESLASAHRAFEFLDREPRVSERPGALSLKAARGDVEFRNVSFSHREDRPVLQDVSFKVPAGTRVGILGPSGAGKTTLVSLLMRFYDPVAGEILLDGVDVRDYRLRDLRDQFALVLQEPILFSTTIRANIAYPRPEASDEEIRAAARAANADSFIRSLPAGYDASVGERGQQLSGGERQRIALARAFLTDAPILILDEPTSAIDTGTEAAILEAIDRLAPGRTSFTISHRFTTLASCDLLMRVDSGRLVDITPTSLGMASSYS